MTSIHLLALYMPALFITHHFVSSLETVHHRKSVSYHWPKPTYNSFGIISWKENTVTKKCEGVIIGTNHVLTVHECSPDYGTTNVITNFVFTLGELSFPVSSVYIIPGNRFLLLQLRGTLGRLQSYAILSWFGEPQCHASYNIRQELISNHPFHLSGRPGHLHECSFVDDHDVYGEMTLSCRGLYSYHLGSAIFKQIPNSKSNVVVGLVREHITVVGGEFLLRCWAMTENDIQDIMSVGMALGSGPPQDTDYIPTGTTIGTFNVHGFSSQKRDMGEHVTSTLVNVFLEAHIMAIQENANIQNYPTLTQRLNSSNLSFVPSTGQSHTHGLGFAFRNNQVVARDCRRLVVKTIKFETYACNFVVSDIQTGSSNLALTVS